MCMFVLCRRSQIRLGKLSFKFKIFVLHDLIVLVFEKKPFEVDDDNGGVVVEVVTKNFKDILRGHP